MSGSASSRLSVGLSWLLFPPSMPAFFEDGVNVCVFMRACKRNVNIRKEPYLLKMIIARMLWSLPYLLFYGPMKA